jgi:hypothetical protein
MYIFSIILTLIVISIKDLIINKRAAGRDQGITDANTLEKVINIKKNEYISINKGKSFKSS